MQDSDSLLNAARTTAECLGLPWAEVQPYYRTLQEPYGEDTVAWLPKSAGRRIWFASPAFIARLLVAMAATSNPAAASFMVAWSRQLDHVEYSDKPHGRLVHGSETLLEDEIIRYLRDAKSAEDLDFIEVQHDRNTIIIVKKDGARVTFSTTADTTKATNAPGLRRRGVIDGAVFAAIASRVRWRECGDNRPYTGQI